MQILFITANRLGDARSVDRAAGKGTGRSSAGAGHDRLRRPFAACLFRAAPNLDRIVILRKRSWNRHWLVFWRECIGTRWDLIVDLRNSLAARLLRHRRYAGHVRGTGQHKVIDNAAILGFDPPPAPQLWLDRAAIQAAADLMPASGPVLALGPAANWPCKQWPVERFTAVMQRLTAADGPLPSAAILILADAKERAGLVPLLTAIPAGKKIELIGKDLLTVAACLQRCALFIGNDSGLMHMAAAMGTPTLGLFGPGYEEIYGPWGPHTSYVRTVEDRAELLARLPHPGAHTPNLMEGLSVGRVQDAALKLLNVAEK